MNEKVKEVLESKEWKDFYNYYLDTGFIEQIGLFRYEDIHTNFLVSVLKEDNIYGYKDKPMRLFLEFIKENCKVKEHFKDIDLSKDYKITNLEVTPRITLDKWKPDIYITFEIEQNNIYKKCVILMELKLRSDEHEGQTCDYYIENEKIKGDCQEKIYIYITLNRDKCHCPNYELFTYQDLVDNLYSKLPNVKDEKVVISIKDYLKSFNCLLMEGYYNIPLTDENTKLTIALLEKLNSFDKTNINKLIGEIYNHTDNNNFNTSISYKDWIRLFSKNIDMLKDKIANKYDINFSPNYAKRGNYINKIDEETYNNSEYIYHVFEKIIAEHDCTYDDLKKINTGKNGYQYIYSKNEYVNLNRYRDCYTIDKYGSLKIKNEEYYYLYCTNSDEIKILIDNIYSDSRFKDYKEKNTFEILDELKKRDV